MNIKRELQNMNKYDLRSISRELGIYCDKNKSNVIKKLLKPLKSKYRMISKEEEACEMYKVLKESAILEFKLSLKATPNNLKKNFKKFSMPINAAYLDSKEEVVKIVKSKIMNGNGYKNWWKKDKEIRVLFGKLLKSIKTYKRKNNETCVKFEKRIYNSL